MEKEILNEQQIEYLNNYHEKCLEVLLPRLEGESNAEARKWVIKNCAKL